MVVYVLILLAFKMVGAPSPYLFAGVLAGAACTMSSSSPQKLPSFARGLALGIVGVQAGSMITPSVLRTVGESPVPTLGSAVATIVISLTFGQLLRFSPYIQGTTASFASIAGGASGLTAIAREFEADEAVVLSVQYMRVLVVIITIPIVAPLLTGGDNVTDTEAVVGWSGLPFAIVSVGGGLAVEHFFKFTASKLILPMVLAAVLSVSNVFQAQEVPLSLLALGFALIGLMVGLDLTREALRRIGTLMPLALVALGLSVVACAATGIALARQVDISDFGGYLATTPGGLPAVTALALRLPAEEVGIVITTQVLRLILALLLGAGIAAWMQRSRSDK